MAHESGPHRLLSIDQLSSRPGVPPVPAPSSWRRIRLRLNPPMHLLQSDWNPDFWLDADGRDSPGVR